MLDLNQIKGVIFDYGGTIDSNGKHWGEVLWDTYREMGIALTKEQFREAYVFAERHLATHPVILPDDNFRQLLYKKLALHEHFLTEKGYLIPNIYPNFATALADRCYEFSKSLIGQEVEILEKIKKKYPVVLVSNFYGNIHAVLKDFGLDTIFDTIVESAVVGIRKPDPAIFSLGVDALGLPARQVAVIGDSYKKDIVPASKIGCATVWLQGPGWEPDPEEAAADAVITDFSALGNLFQL